jgi:Mlc titration factor MtfA (ptsG expression regulator)
VVLHEFAHQLDQESGAANGAPRQAGAQLARWAEVMNAEFQALQQRLRFGAAVRAGQGTWGSWHEPAPEPPPELINAYGATNPAEFFAVVTEVFFEQAEALARRHPALFAVLRDFYRVDPREWPAAGS